jgi:hypothetical protein
VLSGGPGAGLKEGVAAVSVPSNYDDSGISIRVDPNSLYQYATSDIVGHAKSLADSVSNIVQIWQNLKVGWVGASASDAQEFNSRWSQAVDKLFGSDSDPSSGALPKIADSVAQAAMNYGVAEDSITTSLQNYINGLNAGGGGGSTVNSPPTRGGNQGPVGETAPAPPSTPAPSPAVAPSPDAGEGTGFGA